MTKVPTGKSVRMGAGALGAPVKNRVQSTEDGPPCCRGDDFTCIESPAKVTSECDPAPYLATEVS